MARNEHKKVLQQLSEAYQKVVKEETDDDPWGHDDDSDAALWRKQARARMKDPPISDERWKELQNKKPPVWGVDNAPRKEDNEDSITVGDIINQVELDLPLTPDIADALQNVMDTVRSSLKSPPEDDEDEPKRGISGYEHKPDALVSAQKAGAIHKPYVSSFVSDGGKIFGVMGSDGKIVHKTRDKQKAYKWFRDNYEDI